MIYLFILFFIKNINTEQCQLLKLRSKFYDLKDSTNIYNSIGGRGGSVGSGGSGGSGGRGGSSDRIKKIVSYDSSSLTNNNSNPFSIGKNKFFD